jgi:Cytochrome c7 and related cytochrome c
MGKRLLIGVLLAVVAGLAAGLIVLYELPLDSSPASPEQPLPFSHRVHAGTNQISCEFCHRSVRTSPAAGIPALATCRACHLYIAKDRPAIKTLLEYWQRQEPILWVRVHTLPDHVYFPHMMHLRAGLACSDCHGAVATMETLTRVAPLKMGWCLNCHQKRGASVDCWTCHI